MNTTKIVVPISSRVEVALECYTPDGQKYERHMHTLVYTVEDNLFGREVTSLAMSETSDKIMAHHIKVDDTTFQDPVV